MFFMVVFFTFHTFAMVESGNYKFPEPKKFDIPYEKGKAMHVYYNAYAIQDSFRFLREQDPNIKPEKLYTGKNDLNQRFDMKLSTDELSIKDRLFFLLSESDSPTLVFNRKLPNAPQAYMQQLHTALSNDRRNSIRQYLKNNLGIYRTYMASNALEINTTGVRSKIFDKNDMRTNPHDCDVKEINQVNVTLSFYETRANNLWITLLEIFKDIPALTLGKEKTERLHTILYLCLNHFEWWDALAYEKETLHEAFFILMKKARETIREKQEIFREYPLSYLRFFQDAIKPQEESLKLLGELYDVMSPLLAQKEQNYAETQESIKKTFRLGKSAPYQRFSLDIEGKMKPDFLYSPPAKKEQSTQTNFINKETPLQSAVKNKENDCCGDCSIF